MDALDFVIGERVSLSVDYMAVKAGTVGTLIAEAGSGPDTALIQISGWTGGHNGYGSLELVRGKWPSKDSRDCCYVPFHLLDKLPSPLAEALDAGIQASKSSEPPSTPEPGYIYLGPGDKVFKGDEVFRNGEWVEAETVDLNGPFIEEAAIRRKIQTTPLTEDDLLRFTGMPKTISPDHPWWPKPFTRNKYTRDLVALDGRVVPVDVYSVSGAFNLASVVPNGEALDALNHARKKLLAPGQRGAKDVLQDLKEARASLDRAIRGLEVGA